MSCREIQFRIYWRRPELQSSQNKKILDVHVCSAFVSCIFKHKAKVELPERSIYPQPCHTSLKRLIPLSSWRWYLQENTHEHAVSGTSFRVHDLLVSAFRDELRLGPSQPGTSHKCGPLSNGAAGRRSTLIEPERLKDFGEEELLNGDVRVHETRMMEAPEIKLMDPPKTRRLSEFRTVPRPPLQYLRFEDISAAAFRIQSGIQKTPCTVDFQTTCSVSS